MSQASASEPARNESFKVVVVGDGGVGKTTFLEKLATGQMNREYIPTIGVQVNPIDFSTNAGPITFFCWDTAGQEKFGSLRDAYYEGADAAIILFDVTSRATFKNVPTWFRDITRVCGEDIPIVICGNKVDVPGRQVRTNNLRWPKEMKERYFSYFETSVVSGLNLTEPFGQLLKELVGDDASFLGDTSQEPAASPEAPPSNRKRKDRDERAKAAPLAASRPLTPEERKRIHIIPLPVDSDT